MSGQGDPKYSIPNQLEVILRGTEDSKSYKDKEVRLAYWRIGVQAIQIAAILLVGYWVEGQLGRKELEARQTELISNVIKTVSTDPSVDPFALLPSVASFEGSVPHLARLLEAQAYRITDLLAKAGPTGQRREGNVRWPLPTSLLAEDGCADPVYSEVSSMKYAERLMTSGEQTDDVSTKAAALAHAWRIWKAASSSLRALRSPALDHLTREIEVERSAERAEVLLRIVGELVVKGDHRPKLARVLKERLLSRDMTDQARGLAVTFLAVMKSTDDIVIPNKAGLDLACRELSSVNLVGAEVTGVDAGALDFTKAHLKDVSLKNIKHTHVHFLKTTFSGGEISNCDMHVHRSASGDVSSPSAYLLSTALSHSTLRGDIYNAQFRSVDLTETTFRSASLVEPIFEAGSWTEVSFVNSRVTDPTILVRTMSKVRLETTVMNGGASTDYADPGGPASLYSFLCENENVECDPHPKTNLTEG